jgi:hypothetical protein
MKLPFQPALKYQKEHLGDLYVVKFWHDIGALNCGNIEIDEHECLACHVGDLITISNELEYQVCPRCNAGFIVREDEQLDF